MNQLRQSLKRIIAVLVYKQRAGPPCMLSKLDIKYGFWRMIVSEKNAWKFFYALPSQDMEALTDNLHIGVKKAYKGDGVNHHPSYVQQQRRLDMS